LAAVRRHRVRFPHKFALLLKALLTIEGSARLLHPTFDFEASAKGYLASSLAASAGLGGCLNALWRGALFFDLLSHPTDLLPQRSAP
jgi:predicted unusual protein kinase regulating ubiquinone biosynthesis (AarF/ABC1/UbiB family)